jgi:hypothetical protein
LPGGWKRGSGRARASPRRQANSDLNAEYQRVAAFMARTRRLGVEDVVKVID